MSLEELKTLFTNKNDPMDNEGLKQNKKGKRTSKAKNWLSKVLKHCKILKFQCTLTCMSKFTCLLTYHDKCMSFAWNM